MTVAVQDIGVSSAARLKPNNQKNMNTKLKSRYQWLRGGLTSFIAGIFILAVTSVCQAGETYRTATGQFGGVASGGAGEKVIIQGFLGSAFRNSALLPLNDTISVNADGGRVGNIRTDRSAISGIDYVGVGSLTYTIPRSAKRGSTIRLEFYYPGRSRYGSSKGYGAIRVVR